MKFILSIIAVTLLLAVGHFTCLKLIKPFHELNREIVLTRLQSIQRQFVVLETEVQKADVTFDERNLFLGRRHGSARMIVRLHLGFDLGQLKPEAISVLGTHVTVTLPEVRVFDVTPDLSTWRHHSRRSGLFAIWDCLRGRSIQKDLLAGIAEKLSDLAASTDPERRSRMIAIANKQSAAIFKGTGLSVSFK